jgi:hypothetical protein
MSEEQGCKKCKQKNTEVKQWATVVLGFWVLGTSIYGSFVLISRFIEYIKSAFGI